MLFRYTSYCLYDMCMLMPAHIVLTSVAAPICGAYYSQQKTCLIIFHSSDEFHKLISDVNTQ